MAERCINCGGELFPGAKFCRFCGRQSGQIPSEDLPTRIMPDAGTREARIQTSPIHGPRVTHAPAQFPPAAERGRSSLPWVITFIAIGVFAVMFLGLLFLARSFRREPAPRPQLAGVSAPGEAVLGEEGADASDRETVIKRTFKVDPDGTFSLKNMRGDITVEGWDAPDAQVTIIKRGGQAERRATRVMASNSGGNLAFRTAPGRPGVAVDFEVRVPRGLRQIEVESVQSDLRVADFSGAIMATIQNGSIELKDVSGSARTQMIKGETKVAFKSVSSGERSTLGSTNGDIEVSFEGQVDLDVNAETTFGRISADEEFGLDLRIRNVVGQHARGKVGAGGQLLEIRTVRGDIRLVR